MATRFEQANETDIRELIASLGSKNKKGHYYCCKCNDKGVYFLSNKNLARCCKCGEYYSSVDYYATFNNISNIDAVNSLLKNSFSSYKPLDLEEVRRLDQQHKEKLKADYKRALEYSKPGITPQAREYLEARKIFDCLENINPQALQIRSNKTSIIYHLVKQGAAVQKRLDDRQAFNQGAVMPFIHAAYDSNKIVIVEGVEDGLSVHALGYNFLCLNSVSNADKAAELIEKHIIYFKDKEILLCLDNDPPGDAAEKKLSGKLSSLGISHTMAPEKQQIRQLNLKDPNELIINMSKKMIK